MRGRKGTGREKEREVKREEEEVGREEEGRVMKGKRGTAKCGGSRLPRQDLSI